VDKKYLKRASSGLWLYRRKTPTLLKDKYGTEYIQRTLNTHSYPEAILKRNSINADIEMELASSKRKDSEKDKFYEYYMPWRRERLEREGEVATDGDYHPMEEADLEVVIETPEDKANPVVHDAWEAAMTGDIPTLYYPSINELAEEWTTWAKDKKNTKYITTLNTAVKALIAVIGRDDLPMNVTSGQAQMFLDALLNTGKSANTVTHYKSKLQELWRWGLTREKAKGNNPWLNCKVEASKKKSKPLHYRNFNDSEITKILSRTEYSRLNTPTWAYPYTLHMLPRLLPFLGTRLSELALAKTEQFVDVDGRLFFEVREGKTVNAQRIVPVCPIIKPLIVEAIAKAGGSPWLFPEVGNATIGANEAVNSISSKFGKLTKDFDQVEGYKTGLHSFRGHFATALEQVGCPEDIATKLAGHKQLSLTYNLYSKYKNKDELWQYVEKIHKADCLKVLVS
jgi:integrase